MLAKIGRPKSLNPKNKRREIRLTEEEYKKIEDCSKYLKKSRAETILEGIKRIEVELKKK